MKSLTFLSVFVLAASLPAAAQEGEPPPPALIPYEGAVEFGFGVWDTFDADEGLFLSVAVRVPMDDKIELLWGFEAAVDVGNDLFSNDPLDTPNPGGADFDVEIYGTYLTIMLTPTTDREPGSLRLAVGGGGGLYWAHFVEYSDYFYDHVVHSDVAFGTHAVAEIELVYSHGGWIKIQARRIWVEFDQETFRLPSGLSDVNDFSGWQVMLSWGVFF